MSLYFTREHEWIRVEATSPRSAFRTMPRKRWATSSSPKSPSPGKSLAKGDDAAVVESVKAASDVYAPVGGEVIEGNAAIADDPALINRDPEGEGWFFKMKLVDAAELEGLMDEAAYREWVKTL